MRCDCPSEPEVQELCASHHKEGARDCTTNQDGLNEPEIRDERQVPQEEKRSIEKIQGQGDQTEESAMKGVASPATKTTRTLEAMLPKEYWSYREIFEDKGTSQGLLEHKPWYHDL
ncbi:hypothetical protein PHISCL_09967 [Aspergillus sclerotialis]|uniref:Uncharacterized protein n=1 Tax=Aspergillus sclerotialis TaxID=2070753 RepID=A0A3A2Z8T7_9EURO|nr:hypothetical protein PHISCL_09967 [Aspergillus sclerotialis]